MLEQKNVMSSRPAQTSQGILPGQHMFHNRLSQKRMVFNFTAELRMRDIITIPFIFHTKSLFKIIRLKLNS